MTENDVRQIAHEVMLEAYAWQAGVAVTVAALVVFTFMVHDQIRRDGIKKKKGGRR